MARAARRHRGARRHRLHYESGWASGSGIWLSAAGGCGADFVIVHPIDSAQESDHRHRSSSHSHLRNWLNAPGLPVGPGGVKVAAPVGMEYHGVPHELLTSCFSAASLAAVALLPACSSKRSTRDELGAKEAAASATPLADYTAPLDLREFEVAETEGGYRGVFLKLSRLPTSVVAAVRAIRRASSSTSRDRPGTESPEEVFPGGDTMVTHVRRLAPGRLAARHPRPAGRRDAASTGSTRWPTGSWCGSSRATSSGGRGRTGRVEGSAGGPLRVTP